MKAVVVMAHEGLGAAVARLIRIVLPAAAGVLLLGAGSAQAASFVLEDWNGPTVGTWPTHPALDFNGWTAFNLDASTSLAQDGTFGRGLYAKAGLSALAGPGVVEWRWKAPGTSTIYQAQFAQSTIDGIGCLNEGLRTSNGAWQDTENAPPGQTPRRSSHPTACGVGIQPPPVGAEIVVGSYTQHDHFAYEDPNQFCAKRTNATLTRRALKHTAWKYVKLTGTPIAGWIPKNLIANPSNPDAVRCNAIAGNP